MTQITVPNNETIPDPPSVAQHGPSQRPVHARHGFHDGFTVVSDDIGVNVISVEEIFHCQFLAAGLELQSRRHALLHPYRQQVVLASILIMQGISNPKQEIQRLFHGPLVLVCQQPFVLEVQNGFGPIKGFGNPARGMVIAQPSRAFLNIGLHQVHGIGEGRVALATLRDLPSEEIAPPARGETLLVDLLFEPAVELVIPFKETGLSHRRLGGKIGVGHFDRVSPGAYAVSQRVSGIPEQIECLANHVLRRRFVAQEHQIDVRIGVHLSPAISPKSQ